VIHRDETLRRLEALLYELTSNQTTLDKVIATLEETAKDESKREFPTARFMTPATELLITQRYLDVTSDLYNSASDYYFHLIAWNEQLGLWEHSPGNTETWFRTDLEKSGVKEMFRKFKEAVEATRDTIQRRV